MSKLFFSTGTIGIAIAITAFFAWSHAVTPLQATPVSSSINPADMMATYKARSQLSGGMRSELFRFSVF